MSLFYLASVILATFLFSSVKADFNETSSSDQTLSAYVKETTNFLVYKSIKMMVVPRENNSTNFEFSTLGDQIGKVLELIGLVLLVTFLISFIVVPSIIACILCSCGFSKRDSYAALRQSAIGYVESGNTLPKIQSVCACENIAIYSLIGLVIGIPAGIIVGVCVWPYLA